MNLKEGGFTENCLSLSSTLCDGVLLSWMDMSCIFTTRVSWVNVYIDHPCEKDESDVQKKRDEDASVFGGG